MGHTLPPRVLSVTVSLTDAQIKTLPTTPVTIVAAPGAGLALAPLWALLRLKWTANYTNINAAAYIYFDTGGMPRLEEGSGGQVSALLAGGATKHAIYTAAQSYGLIGGIPELYPGVLGTFGNAAIRLSMVNSAGVLTGGNAANALQVTALYARVPIV